MHVTGCSYIEMVQRHRRLRDAFEKQPRLGLVQEFAPEQCLQIIGGLQSDPNRDDHSASSRCRKAVAENPLER